MTAAEAATQTLADWLSARLDEDEAVARAATAGPWRYDAMKVNSVDRQESVFAGEAGMRATTVASTGPEDDRQSMVDAAHISRHDPARVLAEVAAKRAIVDQAYGTAATIDGEWGCCHEPAQIKRGECPSTDMSVDPYLRHLASVYADHEGYREEWRP